jgi:hypothetical protein
MSPGKLAGGPGMKGKQDMHATEAFGIIPRFIIVAFTFL